ncbi:DUF3576 domain-containing protein [Kozakia baliensis]|uniref:DUF3576 domain-containing protein n=1 Tax=Kozakia baliensis TaxID=153496 RepID=UPI00087B2604|nr:DUF3576 domain-containing protein [Kozakia baliensis]AOX20291.1 hypothetical protein A0U90_08280 [Kozakia baliensis]
MTPRLQPIAPRSVRWNAKIRPGHAVRLASMLGLVLLSACGGGRDPDSLTQPRNHLMGVDRGATGGDDQLQGGVNAYLWRGAIDTLSFMPFASADAVGGVILTDWYQPPSSPGERFKIATYILDRRLRSDALRVSVFRQVKQGNEWVDTPVAANTTSDITTRILARARQLRADNGNRDK